jgi:hypothetical protein
MNQAIFTNCLCCGQFVMTQGYEAFYCASKRDTGNITKATALDGSRATTQEEAIESIRKGSHVGCGACLIPYRSGNLHRTRRAIVNESELNDIVKKYNPEILAKRVKPNHANQFQETDPT